MSLREARQLALARHLRDPDAVAAPADLEDRRVAIYRELVYNNVSGLLAGNFPVIRRLLTASEWAALVRAFLSQHAAHTPFFHELGSEFVRFLGEHPEHAGVRPFLHELAHYEWVELALDLSDAELPPADANGDLLHGVPVLSPLAWVLGYQYPVHLIRPEFQPEAPPEQPSWLLVYRNPADRVQFQALQPMAARLLGLIQEQPERSTEAHLAQIAEEARVWLADLLAPAQQLLQGWRERGVLLGTAP